MICTNIFLGDSFSGVFGEEVANRLKTELQYWHLDNLDKCKVGLDVVFKGIDSDQQSKRIPRDKSTKISKSVSKFGFKVTVTIDKQGAIEGAKKGAATGAAIGGIAGAAVGGPIGAVKGAAKGAVIGAAKGAIKGGVRVSFSRSRSRSSSSSSSSSSSGGGGGGGGGWWGR